MKQTYFIVFCFFISLSALIPVSAQTAMQNVYGRNAISLNGKWNALPDWICNGDYRKVWEERTPTSKTDFYEYSFEGTPQIDVPGDFNSQIDQMRYSECWVWYKKALNPSQIDGLSADENGNRKQAFYIMQEFYDTIK